MRSSTRDSLERTSEHLMQERQDKGVKWIVTDIKLGGVKDTTSMAERHPKG